MFKKLLYSTVIMIAFFAIVVAQGQGLPNKIYDTECWEDIDLTMATVMDLDQDGHYESMETIWCDWENGNEFPIMSPIVYPDGSKGMPINATAEDPFPFRKLRKKKPGKKPNMKLEFYNPIDSTVVYDYEMFDDGPEVYYTQYVPYTDVDEEGDVNKITLMPNPASGDVVMSSDLLSSSNVVVKIYNQNGQDMGATVSTGQQISFNVANLASGVYFVHTTVGTQHFVNTLFVVK